MSIANKRRRPIVFLAWFLLVMTVFCFAGILLLEHSGCTIMIGGNSTRPAEAYGLLMLPLNGLLFSLLGTLINTYRPGNRFGWLASLFGVLLMLALLVEEYGRCGYEGMLPLPNYVYALWLASILSPLAFLALVLLPMLFPNGHFLSTGWRRFGIFAVTLAVMIAILQAVWPIPIMVGIIDFEPVAKPFALNIPSTPLLDTAVTEAETYAVLIVFLAGLVSLVIRWRQSKGDERQQMKWLVYHLATAGVLFVIVEIIGESIYPPIFDGWFYLIELAIFWLGLPIVLGFAIFKYRLYDIEVIINRTLVYGLLTALLALIYFGSIIFLQRLFTALTGQTSDLAIVISTLIIAVLFNPLRLRLQSWIDRRFYRRRYNAEQALQSFAVTARDEVDAQALERELADLIRRTVQPSHVSVWTREPHP